ncbi:TetR/AcrR family transcriptional regulator [Nocardioides sp. YIM 152588]|uniref:TetR/AcrR family transcriptional regulator n=1 Tax=Nocardioides sp. YIM 152588 TaxID=3158259 RepID=UPI0032E498B6
MIVEAPYAVKTHTDPSDEVVAFAQSVGAGVTDLHRFWTAPRKNQQARYERILLATIELAREGGYDAIQMRDVTSRSGASLASIYTYFQSRDNLAYRAAVAWASLMLGRARKRVDDDLADATPGERMLARQEGLIAAICEEPNMLALWVRSTMTNDPSVVASQRGVDWSYWNSDPDAPAEADEARRLYMELAQDVFYAGAVRWVFGQEELEHVMGSVRRLRESISRIA